MSQFLLVQLTPLGKRMDITRPPRIPPLGRTTSIKQNVHDTYVDIRHCFMNYHLATSLLPGVTSRRGMEQRHSMPSTCLILVILLLNLDRSAAVWMRN